MAAFRGWLSAAHPFPLTLVLALTALIGVASADGKPDAGWLALALVGMALSQLAIGWSNDYLDRETDAIHQPWKPLPAGLVEARRVPLAVGVVLAGSLAAGAPLGLTPLLLLIAGTVCGLAYNLGLKDTRLSALPFVVALALLPAFVWTALDVYRHDFLLLYAIGSPLALAAHIANALPDIETDAAAGRRGLAVVLGRRWSLALIEACMLAPLVVFSTTLPGREYDVKLPGTQSFLIVWVVMAYVVFGLFIAYRYASDSSREADVWGFRLVGLASVLLAVGWLASF